MVARLAKTVHGDRRRVPPVSAIAEELRELDAAEAPVVPTAPLDGAHRRQRASGLPPLPPPAGAWQGLLDAYVECFRIQSLTASDDELMCRLVGSEPHPNDFQNQTVMSSSHCGGARATAVAPVAPPHIDIVRGVRDCAMASDRR